MPSYSPARLRIHQVLQRAARQRRGGGLDRLFANFVRGMDRCGSTRVSVACTVTEVFTDGRLSLIEYSTGTAERTSIVAEAGAKPGCSTRTSVRAEGQSFGDEQARIIGGKVAVVLVGVTDNLHRSFHAQSARIRHANVQFAHGALSRQRQSQQTHSEMGQQAHRLVRAKLMIAVEGGSPGYSKALRRSWIEAFYNISTSR